MKHNKHGAKMEAKKITAIGVRFGDNDFYNTFIPFLQAIADSGIDSYEFTKEKFVELCHKSLVGFYLVCQNQLRYDSKHIQAYFEAHVRVDNVYFNEEVDQYIKKCGGWDNSEFFVVYAEGPHHKAYTVSI